MTIDDLFRDRCVTPHNINQHLPMLRRLASLCETVTEFGTDIGFSTTAFLAARPAVVRSYDIVRTDWIDTLSAMAAEAGVQYEFHQADTRSCPMIASTDLLLIDSEHTYNQVKEELDRHGRAVRRYLVFHDTLSCPEIVTAIRGWTAKGWDLYAESNFQNGLWVYRKQGVSD